MLLRRLPPAGLSFINWHFTSNALPGAGRLFVPPAAVHIIAAMMIDPVAFTVFGWSVHWYGILWAAGFALFYFAALRHGGRILNRQDVAADVDALLFFGGIGALAGGRLGYAFFYAPDLFADDPLEVIRIWKGGMSFHGGAIGVAAGIFLAARRRRLALLRMADLAALGAPLGIACGRIGNFINGELWGRPSDLPWAMVFARADDQPRHPSQVYEFLFEGVLLYLLLRLLLARSPRPGVLTAGFLAAGALARFAVEFLREPDAHIGLLWLGMSMGQWLSIPTLLAGIALLAALSRRGRLLGFVPAARKARRGRR